MKTNEKRKAAYMLAAGLIFSGSGLMINAFNAKIEKVNNECLTVSTIGTVTEKTADYLSIEVDENEFIVLVNGSDFVVNDPVSVTLEKIDKSLTSSNFENNPENYMITKIDFMD